MTMLTFRSCCIRPANALTFQAITALPAKPLLSYTSYVISGKVPRSNGTGTLTNASPPESMTSIPLYMRTMRITGVSQQGSVWAHYSSRGCPSAPAKRRGCRAGSVTRFLTEHRPIDIFRVIDPVAPPTLCCILTSFPCILCKEFLESPLGLPVAMSVARLLMSYGVVGTRTESSESCHPLFIEGLI